MELLRKVWKFVRRVLIGFSDPPIVTFTNMAGDFGWVSSAAGRAILAVWRLARGVLDIVTGIAEVLRYHYRKSGFKSV
jgi:hypothetical protein